MYLLYKVGEGRIELTRKAVSGKDENKRHSRRFRNIRHILRKASELQKGRDKSIEATLHT